MFKELGKPRAGDWLKSASGRPVGRVIRVEDDTLYIVDVDNEELEVDMAHVRVSLDDAYVLDCELRAIRAEQCSKLAFPPAD